MLSSTRSPNVKSCAMCLEHQSMDLAPMYELHGHSTPHFFSSGCPPTAFNYFLNGDLISAQETHRDLGIIMSSDLSWREHMKSILSRAYKTLNLIRCSFSTCHSPQAKKILYLSLVCSQLTYYSQIWHPHLLKDIEILEMIQHRATKYILNDFTSDYRCLEYI